MLTPENKFKCLSFLNSYREDFVSNAENYVTWRAAFEGLEESIAPQRPQDMLTEFTAAKYIVTEGSGPEMKIKLTEKGKAEYLRLSVIDKNKDARPFREKYWWLIAIITGLLAFTGGIFQPWLSDVVKSKLASDTTKSVEVDTVVIYRVDTVYAKPTSVYKNTGNR